MTDVVRDSTSGFSELGRRRTDVPLVSPCCILFGWSIASVQVTSGDTYKVLGLFEPFLLETFRTVGRTFSVLNSIYNTPYP